MTEFEDALQTAIRYHKVRGPKEIEIPPSPFTEDSPSPIIDGYITGKFHESLLSLHSAYNSIREYVPDDLKGPKYAPNIFSVKEDLLLGSTWAAFSYEIDGFLLALNKPYLLESGSLYKQLLEEYSYKEFQIWLDKVIDDSFHS